jgi:hypothetical protein
MANLDAMRRRFALDEEASVEGGMSPTTTKEQLAQFATMDAQEEANAAGQGASVDDLRFAKRQKQREQEYLDAYGMPMETKPFVQVPPSMRSPEMKDDNRESFAAMAPMAERLMASRKQGLPTTGVDFASLQKTMSPGAFASPIPVARPAAQDGSDAEPGVIKTTMPAVDAANPAGKAGQPTDTLKPPKPAVGAGSDTDEINRLGLGQALVRALEGSGSIIAGRDLRSGAADTLGERMKQIEALRAKREAETETLGRERSQNDQLLDAYKGMFPEKATELESLRGATGKPMFRDLLNAWQKRVELEQVKKPMAEASIGQKQAGAGLARAKTKDIPVSAQTRDAFRRSQVALNKARIDHMGAKKEAESAPASTTGPLADPRLEQRRQDTFSKVTRGAQKLYTDPLIAVASLEKASGPLAQGETPEWWTVANLAKINSGVYLGLPPEATAFAKTYFPVINQLRHALYGSALSAGEQKAFADQIELGLKQGPKALAASIRALADAAKDKTQTQLGYDFGRNPDLAAQWLQSSHFNDKVKGTSLEDTFAEYAKAPAVAGKTPPPMAAVEFLKKNPDQAAAFDLKYGAGSAAEYLGGGR